jgi:mannosyltransferase OCH1-like enzyme
VVRVAKDGIEDGYPEVSRRTSVDINAAGIDVCFNLRYFILLVEGGIYSDSDTAVSRFSQCWLCDQFRS